MRTIKTNLEESQYFKASQIKKYIFLHHTCGYTAQSSIDWWNSKPDRIATPYIIERDGTVYENFDPKYWSFALGVKGGTYVEKASIHIELVSLGPLRKENDRFWFESIKNYRKEVLPEEVIELPEEWRGSKYYHRYTEEQLLSLFELIHELQRRFSIKIQPSVKGFWEYRKAAINDLHPGIWAHSTLREDKTDIYPDKALIDSMYLLYAHE